MYFHIIFYTGGQWLTFIPLFWVSFSGLPRRLHDFPAIFMGWQSMATVGHLVTMAGVLGFYFMLLDSHFEKKLKVYLNTIVPRFNKRILYYIAKFIIIEYNKKLYSFVPSYKVQALALTN